MKVTIDGKQYRIWFDHRTRRPLYSPTGIVVRGYTLAHVESLGTGEVVSGRADCSLRDNYSRSRGRKLALARVLKRRWSSSYLRRQVWEQLFAQGMKK